MYSLSYDWATTHQEILNLQQYCWRSTKTSPWTQCQSCVYVSFCVKLRKIKWSWTHVGTKFDYMIDACKREALTNCSCGAEARCLNEEWPTTGGTLWILYSCSYPAFIRKWIFGKQQTYYSSTQFPCVILVSYLGVPIRFFRHGNSVNAGFVPRRRQRIFPLASASRPALGPTQPPVQWVPGVLSPGIKCGRGVMLTTHPHLVPRLRMSRSYTSSHLNGM
jgi:hypothetical protein